MARWVDQRPNGIKQCAASTGLLQSPRTQANGFVIGVAVGKPRGYAQGAGLAQRLQLALQAVQVLHQLRIWQAPELGRRPLQTGSCRARLLLALLSQLLGLGIRQCAKALLAVSDDVHLHFQPHRLPQCYNCEAPKDFIIGVGSEHHHAMKLSQINAKQRRVGG